MLGLKLIHVSKRAPYHDLYIQCNLAHNDPTYANLILLVMGLIGAKEKSQFSSTYQSFNQARLQSFIIFIELWVCNAIIQGQIGGVM